jgi:hypothetical protein
VQWKRGWEKAIDDPISDPGPEEEIEERMTPEFEESKKFSVSSFRLHMKPVLYLSRVS